MPDGENRPNAAAQCLSSGISIQHNQLACQASKTHPANLNCIMRIFVMDARYHGDFGDVSTKPLHLECCQQDSLMLLQLTKDEFRRSSKEEDVDATVLLLGIPREGSVYRSILQCVPQRKASLDLVMYFLVGTALTCVCRARPRAAYCSAYVILTSSKLPEMLALGSPSWQPIDSCSVTLTTTWQSSAAPLTSRAWAGHRSIPHFEHANPGS